MDSRQVLALLAGILLMVAAAVLALAPVDPSGADTSAGGRGDCGSLASPEDPDTLPEGECSGARTTRVSTVAVAGGLGLLLAGGAAANLDTRVREREGWPPPNRTHRG